MWQGREYRDGCCKGYGSDPHLNLDSRTLTVNDVNKKNFQWIFLNSKFVQNAMRYFGKRLIYDTCL